MYPNIGTRMRMQPIITSIIIAPELVMPGIRREEEMLTASTTVEEVAMGVVTTACSAVAGKVDARAGDEMRRRMVNGTVSDWDIMASIDGRIGRDSRNPPLAHTIKIMRVKAKV